MTRYDAADIGDPRIGEDSLREIRVQAARLRTHAAADRDDLMQAGILGLLRSARRHGAGASLDTFAARAIRGEMVAALGRWSRHLGEADVPASPRGHDEPDGRVGEAVARLGPAQRATVEAIYYREPRPTLAEVAAELGIPASSVRARHFQALRRLRARLA